MTDSPLTWCRACLRFREEGDIRELCIACCETVLEMLQVASDTRGDVEADDLLGGWILAYGKRVDQVAMNCAGISLAILRE